MLSYDAPRRFWFQLPNGNWTSRPWTPAELRDYRATVIEHPFPGIIHQHLFDTMPADDQVAAGIMR